MDICMTFSGTAQSLIKHGIARSVDAANALPCSIKPSRTI